MALSSSSSEKSLCVPPKGYLPFCQLLLFKCGPAEVKGLRQAYQDSPTWTKPWDMYKPNTGLYPTQQATEHLLCLRKHTARRRAQAPARRATGSPEAKPAQTGTNATQRSAMYTCAAKPKGQETKIKMFWAFCFFFFFRDKVLFFHPG